MKCLFNLKKLNDQKSVGPVMVPVADALNHIAKNNAHIRFEKDELLICSTKAIKKVLQYQSIINVKKK